MVAPPTARRGGGLGVGSSHPPPAVGRALDVARAEGAGLALGAVLPSVGDVSVVDVAGAPVAEAEALGSVVLVGGAGWSRHPTTTNTATIATRRIGR